MQGYDKITIGLHDDITLKLKNRNFECCLLLFSRKIKFYFFTTDFALNIIKLVRINCKIQNIEY